MKKFFLILLSVILLMTMTVDTYAAKADSAKEINILFTHDLHSYVDSSTVTVNGKKQEVGGFARIKTIIDAERRKNKNTVVLDGGDFSMGTLYQTMFEKEAIELRLMGQMGYDAATIGNHEFDYSSDALANMLTTAKSTKEKLPALVLSNINWNKSSEKSKYKLKKALNYYGASDYVVIKKGSVKVAVFGLLGGDAENCIASNDIVFNNEVESAKKTVDKIKENGDVDIIICLSHSGTNAAKQKSEDEILAKSIPDIDVIVSGHTHTVLDKPIKIENTYIVSAGAYGKRVGKMSLVQSGSGEWQIKKYKLIAVDESVPADKNMEKRIGKFRITIQDYLNHFGYTSYSQIIAYSPYDFKNIGRVHSEHKDQSIGNLISDAYIYAVKKIEGDQYEPIDISVVSTGLIRSSISEGYLNVADVFKIMSLGTGPNGLAGYPLTSIYLTGKELKTIAEIDASIATVIPAIQLYCSGLNYEFNPKRVFYYRITDIKIETENGKLVGVDENKLYRVVTGLWTAKMLSMVDKKYSGLLKIVPKYSNGEPISDLSKAILYDKSGKELKEWYALSSYLESFDKVNGVSVIPDKYSASMERKSVNNTSSTNINKISSGLYLMLIIVIVSILLFLCILRLMHRIKGKVKII